MAALSLHEGSMARLGLDGSLTTHKSLTVGKQTGRSSHPMSQWATLPEEQSRTRSIPVWRSREREVFHSPTYAFLRSSPYPGPYWVTRWYRTSKCALPGQLPMRCRSDDRDSHSPIRIIVGSGAPGKAPCKFRGRATTTSQCSVLSTR